MEDITIAQRNSMDFIRIGITVQDCKKARPYIVRCKTLGLQVFVNFMKTYTSSPMEFAAASKEVHKEGADCVYIVDSAGSMSAGDIGGYIDAARLQSDVQMGFHGHNNLGLAIDNTIYCVKRGIDYIECSFQGSAHLIGVGSLNKVSMDYELLYNIAESLPKDLDENPYSFAEYFSEKYRE